MQLEYYYWYFDKALSSNFCDEVIKFSKDKQKLTGVVGAPGKLKDLKEVRDTNISWIDDQWVMNEIYPYVNMANKNANWNFEISAAETAQFTEYKPGQFYGWHLDQYEKPYHSGKHIKIKDPILIGKIRKLSVSVLLSDPKDYKGGDLQFQFRNKTDPNIINTVDIKSKGSVIVFPSNVWHQVTPVTKGIRHSLVIWNLGQPYK